LDNSGKDLFTDAAQTRKRPGRHIITVPEGLTLGFEDTGGAFDDMDAQLDEFSWDNDHAYLHFAGGGLATPGEYNIPCIMSESARVARSKKGQTIRQQQHLNIASTSSGRKTRRDPGKQLQTPEDELVSDVAWEMTMKEKILQDTELYLRIIRYEVG